MKCFTAGILLVCNTAMAQNYADVINVKPNMVTVNEQRCEQVAVQRPATSGDTAGGIFGAIAGAAIGNQIGGGSGKDIATAAGAAIGSQIGRGQPQPGGIESQADPPFFMAHLNLFWENRLFVRNQLAFFGCIARFNFDITHQLRPSRND